MVRNIVVNLKDDPRLYSPPGYNPVAMMPDASLSETTMRPISAMSVSDRPSSLVPGIPRAYGTMSDNDERFGVGELDQKALNNKALCAVLSCCGIYVVVCFLLIILFQLEYIRVHLSTAERECQCQDRLQRGVSRLGRLRGTFGSPWSSSFLLSQSSGHVMSS